MARHDDKQQISQVNCAEGVENQRFLAFARAGHQPDRTVADRAPPAGAQFQPFSRRRDVELEIAADGDLART